MYTKPYITKLDISGLPELTDDYLPPVQHTFMVDGVSYPIPEVRDQRGRLLNDFVPEQIYDKHIYRRILFHKDWDHIRPQIIEHADKFSEMHGIGKLFMSYNHLNRYDIGEYSHSHRHIADGDVVAAVLYFQDHPVPLVIYDDDDSEKAVEEIYPEPGLLVVITGGTWHRNPMPNPGPVRWALTTNFSTEHSIETSKKTTFKQIYEMNAMMGRVR